MVGGQSAAVAGISPMATRVVPWMPAVFSRSMAARTMLDSAAAVRSAWVRGWLGIAACGCLGHPIKTC